MRSLLPLALLLPAVSFGWGFDGHQRLSSLMQNPLPGTHCLRDWYASRQTSALQDHSCDPDRWRQMSHPMYDPNEWTRHYLEVDWIQPPSAYPRDWATVVATFPNYYERNGRVPWRVEEMYAQLVAAFQAKNTTQILDLTFVLSHYVTDAFSVLHDTKDYNPGGVLHSRWESDMLNVSAQLNGISTLATSSYVGTAGRADPKNNIFDIVLVGNGLQPQLVAAHNANPTDEVAFYNAVRDLTARRWGDALTLLASIIWSAWADAGAPVLNGFPTSGCSLAVPTAEIVLKGFPVPGGFTHPDGGASSIPDASVVIPDGGPTDAGCFDGTCTEPDAGGTGGGSGGSGGGSGGGDTNRQPCGCGSAPGALLLVLLLAWRRRR